MIQYYKYENRAEKWFYISVNEQILTNRKFATIIYDGEKPTNIEVKEIHTIQEYWNPSTKDEFEAILTKQIGIVLHINECIYENQISNKSKPN